MASAAAPTAPASDAVSSLSKRYTDRMLLLRYAKFVEFGPPSQRAAAAEAALQYLEQPDRYLDVEMYRSFAKVAGRVDKSAWVSAQIAKANAHAETLARELNVARAHQLRDDTFKYYALQGKFATDRGNLADAESCWLSAREYCSTSGSTVNCHLTLAWLAVLGGDYSKASLQLGKVEGVAELALDGNPDKVHALRGLYALSRQTYEEAARELLEMSPTPQPPGPVTLLHPDDAALIGGLAALATYSREEIKSAVLVRGKAHVDKHPDLRNAMAAFVEFKFDRMRACLQALQPALAVDYFVCGHVDALLRLIMQRAMEAYLIPYSTIKLGSMAAAFGITVTELTKQLSELIRDGRIQARIDSVGQTLVSHTATPRAAAYERVLATARQMQTDARILLIRASMEKANLRVRDPVAGSTGGGGAYHPSAAAMAAAGSAPLAYGAMDVDA